uniref:AAA+ ATPase domain-containing protein n=1 Tax=Glossina morsitans morsitans TaxID=37546 RepID=A0A1B0FN51_GLOMM
MDSDTKYGTLLNAYLCAENKLIKEEVDVDEKFTAWRQQAILIPHLVERGAFQNDFMERHCSRRDCFIDDSEFVKKRLQGVETLINKTKQKISPRKITSSDMPDIDKIKFPPKEELLVFTQQDRERPSNPSSSSDISQINVEEEERPRKISRMQAFVQTDSSEKPAFRTALDVFLSQKAKKCDKNDVNSGGEMRRNTGKTDFNLGPPKKSLGTTLGRYANANKKGFVPPLRTTNTANAKENENKHENLNPELCALKDHPALKNIDMKIVEMVTNEIIHELKSIDWCDIAGLDYAKSIIKEAVVYPLLRPDIFTGLRRPPRGILLFGPPGTGKTLIGKCIASQAKATFFSISSSSLTSKWIGESEKLVRALFAVAEARQPSVIFIDEVDSMLCQRSDSENEAYRRMKTEFLVRLDGASTSDDDRVLVVGATNRPQELDEAVRRRFVKRLYIPLPELEARINILTNLLKTVKNSLNFDDLKKVATLAEGYSGADMDSLCREASMQPLRSIPPESIMTFNMENLRGVDINDFHSALKKIRPSVSQQDLQQYLDWNKIYGSSS